MQDTLVQIDLIKRIIDANLDVFKFARTAAEISQCYRQGKIASLIGVEGFSFLQVIS